MNEGLFGSVDSNNSNVSYIEINNLIQKYDFHISLFRTENQKKEETPEVRRKLRELSELCSSSS